MGAQQKIEPATVIPFNAFSAYQRERTYSRRVEKALGTALSLLTMECGRRELRGEDVSHIRDFIREAAELSL